MTETTEFRQSISKGGSERERERERKGLIEGEVTYKLRPAATPPCSQVSDKFYIL